VCVCGAGAGEAGILRFRCRVLTCRVNETGYKVGAK
jgi:hypothetical protein